MQFSASSDYLSLRPTYSMKQFLLVHSQFTFQCKFEERSLVESECKYPRNETENVDTDQINIHFRRTRVQDVLDPRITKLPKFESCCN